MCGIAGFFSSNIRLPLCGVEAACRLMRHRGPDDEGFVALSLNGLGHFRGLDTVVELNHLPRLENLSETQLLLGHRRLSIIDLSVDGHQPLVDASSRYAMVFNGEIFNYLELRAELETQGCVFHTHSDTEVVLQAWIHWGRAAFNKFNGMWAIAIWDQMDRRLILCRDRFGVKPLYIARQHGALYFSSEMKTLLAWPGLAFEPSQSAISNYLDACLLNHSVGTFWTGIEELPPGSWLEINGEGREASGLYWLFEPHEIAYCPEEAEEKFAALFEDSIRLRMRSDVEVGTLLSGGLDSNTIVAGLYKLGLIEPGKFKSFSAIFSEEQFSEEQYIRATLSKIPLAPYMIRPDPNDLRDDLKKLLYHIEEPFRSLSVYSQFKIYQRMHTDTRVKVVLNGQGADEMFGGYTGHYFYLFAQLVKRKQYIGVLDEMRRFASGRGLSYINIAKQFARTWLSVRGNSDCFSSRLFSEVRSTPLREYLKYDDRTSMSASVEARTPFLDYRLVEFAFSLPMEFKIHKFENKKIERNYARKFVPTVIVNRQDKMGFVSPQEIWQKRELAPWFDQTFERIKQHKTYFPGAHAASLYQQYRNGKYNGWDHIWRYFCLMHWMEQNGVE